MRDAVRIFVMLQLPAGETALKDLMPGGVDATYASDCHTDAEKLAQLGQADAAFGHFPVAWLRQSPRLRWVQLESIGVDSYTPFAQEEWARRIQLTNLRGILGPAVAESLIGGILALYRCLPAFIRLQDRKAWDPMSLRPQMRTLHGQHAVILGAGSIGLHLRQLLSAFGVKVQTYARSAAIAEIRSLSALDAALPETDILASALPDDRSTSGLLDARRLGLLPRHAVIANGGRGSLIDESALVDALGRQRLGGAVLDVTLLEPLPPSSPLWILENVVLTQHTGGASQHTVTDKNRVFLENLARFLAGAPLENRVKLSA